MKKLADIRVSKKLAIASAATILQMACLAALSLWALNQANTAAAKAQHYFYKLNLAERIDTRLAELALRMAELPFSTQVGRDVAEILAIRKAYATDFAYLKTNATTDEDRGLLGKIEEVIVPWRDLNNQTMQSLQAGRHVDTNKVAKESLSRYQALSSTVADYLKYRQIRLETMQQEQLAANARVRRWVIVCCLLVVLTATGLSSLIARDIGPPLAAAVDHLNQVADGDISRDVSQEYLDRGDETGNIGRSMEKMTVALRKMMQEISGGIQVLSSSSTELVSTSTGIMSGSQNTSEKAHSVSAAAEEMSSNISNVAAAMEETTTNLSHVTSATEQMTSTIGEIAKNSEKGRGITDDATRQAARITEQINQLGVAAREIGKVTETITEISSQTNLLALNATIEAARAGAAGKGFAVVANEIKALAQQTAAATEDIKVRIDGVQSATAGGITEIGKVSQIIQEVNAIVTSIAAAIEEQSAATKDIARNISEASVGVAEATARVSETSQVSREIAKDILCVDQAAGEMANGSENVRTSVSELSKVAEQLQTLISHFRVGGVDRNMLKSALSAHANWTARLRAAIVSGKLDVAIPKVKADDQCQFGKWLFGEQLAAAEKQTENYLSVKQLHARFHEAAAKVAQYAITGQREAAENAMNLASEYATVSSALADALNRWSGAV